MNKLFPLGLSLALALFSVPAQAASWSSANLQFGDTTNARPAPTTGTLTGIYRTRGDWVQTGPITCNACRLYFGGKVTINNAITGVAGADFGSYFQRSHTSAANIRGGGGGHGGAGGHAFGGQSGSPAYSTVPDTIPTWPLTGQGGWDDGNSATPGAGGLGGAGLYVEARGQIHLTATAAITCTGTAGTSGGQASGGGSGGGIDMRSWDAVVIDASAALTANGGVGGNGSGGGDSAGGGGGGAINIEALQTGSSSNAGTLTVAGGAGGTGGAGPGTAGAVGVTRVFQTFSGPRLGSF
jgi:hypothetical protein